MRHAVSKHLGAVRQRVDQVARAAAGAHGGALDSLAARDDRRVPLACGEREDALQSIRRSALHTTKNTSDRRAMPAALACGER